MEEKSNITADNYKKYDELYSLKYGDKKSDYFFSSIKYIAVSSMFLGSFLFVYPVFNYSKIINDFPFEYIFISSFVSIMIPSCLSDIIYKFRYINPFKKNNPNIDFKIKKKYLEKELVKYKELEKVPDELEIKKEEHLNNYNDEIRNMTTKEKIEFLKKERNFWETVAIKEKYDQIEELEKPKQKINNYNK